MSISEGGGLSAADVAAVTRNNNSGGLFGNGDGAWWIIILFLFAFCGGWGNGGFYGGGGSGGGANNGYVLTSDFAITERKLDSITNGLCDGFYTNAQLINGTNMQLASGFSAAQLERSNQQAAIMQQLNNMGATNAQCCCEIREGIAGVNYNMATHANALQNSMCLNTRDIIDSQNANTRAILDTLNAQSIEAKNEKIADLQQRLQEANLAASQARQNTYIIDQLRPCPVPAYQVPNPYAYSNCGCNCGC